jgi:fumarate hydratase class II
MGEVLVPDTAYYGSQTQRAVDNSFASGLTLPIGFIHALALIKRCAAHTNDDLGLLETRLAAVIMIAAEEVMGGRWNDQFIVDVFQTGSGTSTHMNMNEVLAARANELLTGQKGGRSPVHPNDHVNLGQSSNDVMPSALHIAAVLGINRSLLPALYHLQEALQDRESGFASIRKLGRTHLQDAVPMTLGQAFGGFVRQIELGSQRISGMLPQLTELALGGTAVGSGINTHPDFAGRTIGEISDQTGIRFVEARNHFEAQGARDASLEASGTMKTVAAGLVKIANDIRWLGSGPRCGIGELKLPALQPGSSIMPGKVNPIVAEAVIQAAYQVMGNDTTITLAAQAGNFELNVTIPIIAYNLLQSLDLLAGAARLLADKCIAGLQADRAKCEGYIESSLALVTGLVPHIGYDRAADLAKKAHESGKTIRQVALEEKILPEAELSKLLD